VSASVVSAFEEVDRAQFMSRASRDKAYSDQIIDLEEGSTISQPSLVAQMIELLKLEGREKILEVGTATGYQAALLSRLALQVDTVEISPHLAYWAKSNLKRLHYPNVTVHQGDGLRGVPEGAPFDAIMVTAGLKSMPSTLFDQLALGGRLVAPVGVLPEETQLKVFTKISDTEFETSDVGACRFVPLYSPEIGGWTAESLQEARDQRRLEIEGARSARRKSIKEAITAADGEEAYIEFIQQVGVPAASIVGKKLTEDQVLDLADFFSGIFGPRGKSSEPEPEEARPKEVLSVDTHPVDMPPAIVMKTE
jgi:protein-L-isoaspartate(D-aspartate) O-methyltransferase